MGVFCSRGYSHVHVLYHPRNQLLVLFTVHYMPAVLPGPVPDAGRPREGAGGRGHARHLQPDPAQGSLLGHADGGAPAHQLDRRQLPAVLRRDYLFISSVWSLSSGT